MGVSRTFFCLKSDTYNVFYLDYIVLNPLVILTHDDITIMYSAEDSWF